MFLSRYPAILWTVKMVIRAGTILTVFYIPALLKTTAADAEEVYAIILQGSLLRFC